MTTQNLSNEVNYKNIVLILLRPPDNFNYLMKYLEILFTYL